jgi:hypothetical protein
MKLVIVTGCPCTGWERVVPALTDAGLEAAADAVAGWQDRLLAASSVEDPLQLRQPLQPDMSVQEELASLLTNDQSDAERLVVNRCPWLLDFWAASYPDAQFLLFFTRAEAALAQALVCGLEPIQFIKDWEAHTRHLIRFQRRYRQRVLLLSVEAASENPAALVETARIIGLSLNVPTESTSREVSSAGEIERFLARRLMADNPALGALESELDARAHPLGDLPPQASEVVLEDLLKCFFRVRQGREELRSQFHHLQYEFEQVVLEKQTVEGSLVASGTKLSELQARAMQLEQARQDGELSKRVLEASKREILEENDLLIGQLHEVQEELEKVVLEKQQLEQAEEARGVELREVHARVAQVDRARQEVEINKQSLAASQRKVVEENDLLIGQLHEVQEELERVFLEKQQLGEVLAATSAELQQLRVRLALVEKARQEVDLGKESLEASNRSVREENGLLIRQLHDAKEDLKKLVFEKKQFEQGQDAIAVELLQARARITQLDSLYHEEVVNHQLLEASKRELLEENKLLVRQLRERQEALEEAFLEKQQLEMAQEAMSTGLQRAHARSAEIEIAREELEASNRSLETNGKQVLDENELLLKQLHQVQEELEFYFLQYQETLTSHCPVPEEQSPEMEEATALVAEPQEKAPQKKTSAWTNQNLIRTIFQPFKRPDRKKDKLRRQIEVLNKSGLFDQEWYLSTYQDVAAADVNPTEHYVRFGAAEGRNPSPKFETAYYLQSNPDVAAAGVNPLLHYIQFGISEGRQACGEKTR